MSGVATIQTTTGMSYLPCQGGRNQYTLFYLRLDWCRDGKIYQKQLFHQNPPIQKLWVIGHHPVVKILLLFVSNDRNWILSVAGSSLSHGGNATRLAGLLKAVQVIITQEEWWIRTRDKGIKNRESYFIGLAPIKIWWTQQCTICKDDWLRYQVVCFSKVLNYILV